MQLEIDIRNKIPRRLDDYAIICGNDDYTILFSFDSEWDDYTTKTARFNYLRDGAKKHVDVVFDGSVCEVPPFYGIKSVEVGVFAGDLKTTTVAMVKCEKSALCDGGAPEAPSEDVYNQIMALLNGASADILSNPTIWELDAGIYHATGKFQYGMNENDYISPVGSYTLIINIMEFFGNKTYSFCMFDTGGITWGISAKMSMLDGSERYEGHIHGEISRTTDYITTTEGTEMEIPTAKAVAEHVATSIGEAIIGAEEFSGEDEEIVDDKAPSIALFYGGFMSLLEQIEELEKKSCNVSIVDEFDVENTDYEKTEVYNANTINAVFGKVAAMLEAVEDRLGTLEMQSVVIDEISALVGGAE